MNEFFLRSVVGCALGLLVGFFFPDLFPTWLLVGTGIGIVLLVEVARRALFTREWCKRWMPVIYKAYVTPILWFLLGVLLISGKLGKMLIWIGTHIS